MRYSLNPEFDARIKEAFDKVGWPEEGREALLDLMDRAAAAFAYKVSLRTAKDLVEEGLSPEKIKCITYCDIEEFMSAIH